LLVQRLVVEAGRPELALAALQHDSHEAYLGDIPTPRVQIVDITEVESHREPLVQVADLFAGMAVYSRASFEVFEWRYGTAQRSTVAPRSHPNCSTRIRSAAPRAAEFYQRCKRKS